MRSVTSAAQTAAVDFPPLVPDVPVTFAPGSAAPTTVTNTFSRSLNSSRAQSLPTETVIALYERIANRGNLQGLIDQQARLNVVLERAACSNHADARIDDRTLGKALKVLCCVWRSRDRSEIDRAALARAVELCATLILRREQFALETCGVIMFHLGELMTFPPVQLRCAELIYAHLAPRFHRGLLAVERAALSGADATFGLVSTLRASELQLRDDDGALRQCTSADLLVGSLHEVMKTRPDLFQACNSGSLGLLAKHAMHYLHSLAKEEARTGLVTAGVRQKRIALLIKRCIDELNSPGSRPADAAQVKDAVRASAASNRFDDPLGSVPQRYAEWLGKRCPDAPPELAPRAAPMSWAAHAARAATSEASRQDSPQSAQGAALSRLGTVASGLSESARSTRAQRDVALDVADMAMTLVQQSRFPLSGPDRARMVLDLDTVCRHVALTTPLGTLPGRSMDALHVFMHEQLACLVDTCGRPLLGPALPSPGGLHSWQRMLLGTLLE